MRKSPVLAGAAAILLLLAALPAAAQEPDLWEGRWRTEIRTYAVAEKILGMEKGHRQLWHSGTHTIHFGFCVAPDGSISGSGMHQVERNPESELFKPFEDFGGGQHSSETTWRFTFRPSRIELPVKVQGERRGGEDFWLFLNWPSVEFSTAHLIRTRVPWREDTLLEYEVPVQLPASHLVYHHNVSPLDVGLTISAQDGAEVKLDQRDSSGPNAGWVPGFSTFSEQTTRVQIRRPKMDPADELPILLGQHVFQTELAWVSPGRERVLEAVLLDLKAALDGNAGKFRCGRPGITVVIGKGPNDDDLFLEALNRARRDQLREWFRTRGIEVDRIDWHTAFGPEDDVQVSFGG